MKEKKEPKERKPRSAQRDASHKKNWKEYMATVEDIQNFIMDRILLRHNVITRRVEFRLPSSYEHEGTDWQPISDRVVNTLWSELSATKVVRRSPEEMKSIRQVMAACPSNTDTDVTDVF